MTNLCRRVLYISQHFPVFLFPQKFSNYVAVSFITIPRMFLILFHKISQIMPWCLIYFPTFFSVSFPTKDLKLCRRVTRNYSTNVSHFIPIKDPKLCRGVTHNYSTNVSDFSQSKFPKYDAVIACVCLLYYFHYILP